LKTFSEADGRSTSTPAGHEFYRQEDSMAEKAEQFWLQGRYAALLRGELSVEDLDDEELARGRLRASDGTFRGRPPKVVPADLVAAMRKEWIGRAEETLRAALHEHGIGTYVKLASDPDMDPAVRLRAADKIVERTMGKVPDRVTIAAEDPVETLFRSILADPQGLAPAPHEPSAEEREMLS
jgi:hypothetical protein